ASGSAAWPNGTCNVPCSTRASDARSSKAPWGIGELAAVMLRPGDERVVGGGCLVGSLAEPGADAPVELTGLPGGDGCHVAAPGRVGEDLGERDGFGEGDDPRAERCVRPELAGPGAPARRPARAPASPPVHDRTGTPSSAPGPAGGPALSHSSGSGLIPSRSSTGSTAGFPA